MVLCAVILAGAPLAKQFSFRPALLRGVSDWQIAGHTLTGPTGDCDLTTVTQLRWVNHRIGDNQMLRLDLRTRHGSTQIALNIAANTGQDDPDRKAHLALCSEVAQTLAAQNPALIVFLGESTGARWAMFAVGLFTLSGGLGLAVAIGITGVSSDRLGAVTMPVLMLIGLGAFLIKANGPWRKPLKTNVSTLTKILAPAHPHS